MSDIEREEFEQAFLNQYTDFERFENGEYMDDFLQQSWIGWQASRQALEGEPVAWWDGDTSAAEDSFSFKLNRCYTIPLYTHPASAAKQAVSVPSILYDGYAVFQEVQHARNSKGLENIKDSELVSDVLDAVVKLIKQEKGQ